MRTDTDKANKDQERMATSSRLAGKIGPLWPIDGALEGVWNRKMLQQ